MPTQRRSFLRRLDQGGGLYNDYAVLALYDGAQLLLAALLVIFAGGLAVEVSLYWWLIALALTICSWLLAPFIFNPYQSRGGWSNSWKTHENARKTMRNR